MKQMISAAIMAAFFTVGILLGGWGIMLVVGIVGLEWSYWASCMVYLALVTLTSILLAPFDIY